jgi:hypothetical protein
VQLADGSLLVTIAVRLPLFAPLIGFDVALAQGSCPRRIKRSDVIVSSRSKYGNSFLTICQGHFRPTWKLGWRHARGPGGPGFEAAFGRSALTR